MRDEVVLKDPFSSIKECTNAVIELFFSIVKRELAKVEGRKIVIINIVVERESQRADVLCPRQQKQFRLP